MRRAEFVMCATCEASISQKHAVTIAVANLFFPLPAFVPSCLRASLTANYPRSAVLLTKTTNKKLP